MSYLLIYPSRTIKSPRESLFRLWYIQLSLKKRRIPEDESTPVNAKTAKFGGNLGSLIGRVGYEKRGTKGLDAEPPIHA